MSRTAFGILAVLGASMAAGCRAGVRDFAEMDDPAPFNRARAAGLDDQVSDSIAIPTLIRHLDDPDAVVRLSAHESLRSRTGRDFGYLPYDRPDARSAAAERWWAWWQADGHRAAR